MNDICGMLYDICNLFIIYIIIFLNVSINMPF